MNHKIWIDNNTCQFSNLRIPTCTITTLETFGHGLCRNCKKIGLMEVYIFGLFCLLSDISVFTIKCFYTIPAQTKNNPSCDHVNVFTDFLLTDYH